MEVRDRGERVRDERQGREMRDKGERVRDERQNKRERVRLKIIIFLQYLLQCNSKHYSAILCLETVAVL